MKKILVVEDDEIIASVMGDLLRRNQFEVALVGGADGAWEKVHQFLPDLVLLDILIPETDGWELLKKFKNHIGCFCRRTKVVILSNVSSMVNDREKAMGLGALDFWLKANFTPGELVEKIKKILV